MTHNTVYSDDSVRACGQIIRTYSTNMHHERTTSAALLSAMLEQDSVPALRSQESGAERPTSTGEERNVEHRARQDDLPRSVLDAGWSAARRSGIKSSSELDARHLSGTRAHPESRMDRHRKKV